MMKITAVLLYIGYIGAIRALGSSSGAATYEKVYNECDTEIDKCHHDHPRLAYEGLPEQVYSPDEFSAHCSETSTRTCLGNIDKTICTQFQKLQIEGEIMADNYVCSSHGLNKYKQKNQYTDTPWKCLKEYYMPEENSMCQEKFLHHTYGFFDKSQEILVEVENFPADGNANDKLETENKAKIEMGYYCNYMYAYQDCLYFAAKRHCNDTIADWQNIESMNYFTPHYQFMGCHIGDGLEPITINAIVVVAVVLGLIFSLAAFCGVYEKCYEKCKVIRRRKNKHFDVSEEDDKKRPGVMIPGYNGGMPERNGSTKVKFDIHAESA